MEEKTLSYESDIVFAEDVRIHVIAEQCVGYEYINGKRTQVTRDGFNITLDLSEFNSGIFGKTEIIFKNNKIMTVGSGWAQYKINDKQSFYTEWNL